MTDGYPAGQQPDGTEAQHNRLRQMNEDIRTKTGERCFLYAQHDGMHKYFFQGSDQAQAVIGIKAALEYMELKWSEVFHVGPSQGDR